jgi:hypothetical protein
MMAMAARPKFSGSDERWTRYIEMEALSSGELASREADVAIRIAYDRKSFPYQAQ